MWMPKIFLLLSIIITAEISGACVVSSCSPQLDLYEINGSIAPAGYKALTLDMIETNTGALIAVGFGETTGNGDGFVELYSFQGTDLVLENTIDIPIRNVNSVALLKDNDNYFLAVGANGAFVLGGDSQIKVFNITNLAVPVELMSIVRNVTRTSEVDWLPTPFVDGSGDTNYFLAISATSSGVGAIRVDIWQLNVDQQTVTTNVTGDNLAGFGFSVDWLSSGGSFYLASSVVLGTAAPTSGIGVYDFSAFPASLSTPAQNVPVEASSTSDGQVGWFSLSGTPYLASAYKFGGSVWLKTTQFTPPSTFTVTPSCGFQLSASGSASPTSVSNVLIGGDNYITASISGETNSLQIYKYDPSGGGSYCLAYQNNFGDANDAKWITIGGKQYLGLVSGTQTGCLNNTFHILALTNVPETPTIDTPTPSQIFCDVNIVSVTGTALGAACGDLQLSIDGGAYSIVVSDLPASGEFSFNTPSLSDGSHTLSVKSVLSTGAESTPTSVTITIDTQTPAAPVISGQSTCIYCGPQAVTISGTAEANIDITIYNNGLPFGLTTTADGSGNWSVTTGVLGAGNYSFTATASDECHESAQSNVLCYVITATVQSPVISNASECITCGPNPYTITGTNGVPNNIVTIYQDAVQIGQTTADNSGNWSFMTPLLPEGTYHFTATTTDNCNRTSTISNSLCIIITNLPVAPTINSPTGCQSFTGGVTTISGTGPVSSPIYVYISGTLVTTTATDASGAWSTVINLPSTGIYFVSTRALDDCMRLSAASNIVCFTIGQISALVQAIVEKYCPFAH